MLQRCYLILFFILLLPCVYAQVLPAEGSQLCYRLIGFSVPGAQPGERRIIEIARGSFNSDDSFKINIIRSATMANSKIIIEVPRFGESYTWRVVTARPDGMPGNTYSPLYHFKTLKNFVTDTNFLRLRVLKTAAQFKDGYVFLDGNKGLYDMDGNMVWFLPDVEGMTPNMGQVTDLKMSPVGTITFIYEDQRAYEIDYNGNVLWKGPNNEIASWDTHYHHELTRLANGHYMVLGTEPVYYTPKLHVKNGLFNLSYDGRAQKDDAGTPKIFPMGMVSEYNKAGTVVWEWKFADYYKKSDLVYTSIPGLRESFDSHINAFYFDEQKKIIYLSFRNISRILKVAYPSGKVLNTFGPVYGKQPSMKQQLQQPLFKGQHSCRLSAAGELYLYNNNVDDSLALPTIVVCREDTTEQNKLVKVWEYECTIDEPDRNKYATNGFTRGGNVAEQPGNSFFVSMSSPVCKVFIVSRDKQILWSAMPEVLDVTTKQWVICQQYRASFVKSRKELEQMIWYTEAGK